MTRWGSFDGEVTRPESLHRPDVLRTSMRSIWVVEDDEHVRGMIVETLHHAGFLVTGLSLAERALEALRSSSPDAIVLDVGMPRGRLQGMEFLAQLRETDEWKTIPVLILSGLGDVINRDVTRRLGVAAVLGKPVTDLRQLVQLIGEIVR